MKATDLMIGDYIQDLAGDLCQVIVIDRQVAQVETLTGVHQGDTTRYLHEAEGVPLTPKILEKNGFVKEEFKESPYVDWYKLVYSAYPNKETELVEVNIVKENNEIVGIACAKMMHTNHRLFRIEKYREMNIYVHELQHSLRLCGIDKEITL